MTLRCKRYAPIVLVGTLGLESPGVWIRHHLRPLFGSFSGVVGVEEEGFHLLHQLSSDYDGEECCLLIDRLITIMFDRFHVCR